MINSCIHLLMINKYLRLFCLFRKISFMKLSEYRSDFFFWTLISTMWTAFNFFFFALLINLNQNIAGWGEWQLYLLLSVFTMLDAATWSIMGDNMWQYTNDIFSGRLSVLLLKPIDFQFAVMTQSNTFNNLPRFFIGLFALIYSANQLKLSLSLTQVALFILSFLSAFLMIYLLWFIVATLAFHVERLDNINEIVPSLRRIWQLPRSIYSGIFSTIFTVIIPIGLAVSIPSEIILGQSYNWTWYLIFWTLGLFLFSRAFVKFSLKKYTSVGS